MDTTEAAPSLLLVHEPGVTAPGEAERGGGGRGSGSGIRGRSSGSLGKDGSSSSSSAIPDLLLRPAFLWPFLSLCVLTFACFGIIRAMCAGSVPDNCNLGDHTLLVQQILASVERMFLVVAVSDFHFLWGDSLAGVAAKALRDNSTGWTAWRPHILRPLLFHLLSLASCIVVSAALSAQSVRQGMGAARVVVAIVLLVVLLPPLVYCVLARYSPARRAKALCVVVLYLAFLLANAGLKALHVHHWTWAWVYLAVHYAPSQAAVTTAAQAASLGAPGPASSANEQGSEPARRFMDEWARCSSMVALGILIEGLTAYGSSFFFISTPWPN